MTNAKFLSLVFGGFLNFQTQHFHFKKIKRWYEPSLKASVLFGLLCGLGFWGLDSVIVNSYSMRGYWLEFFHPQPADFFARVIVALGCVSFTSIYGTLRRVEGRLFESQDRMRAIIAAEPECVKLLDDKGSLLEMNPAGLVMIEADSFEQVSGMCVYPLVGPYYRAEFIALVERGFAGQSGKLDFEIRGLKGGQRWLATHAVPLYDRRDSSKITAVLAITRDVTDRKKVERDLVESKEVAEKANQAKDLFLATLSHELRTPLTSILGWSQLINSGRVDSSKMKVALQTIEDSALSQNQLISDLLDISRISTGKIALDIQKVELVDIIEKAVNTVRVSAEKKGIQLLAMPSDRPLFVYADAGRMRQVIWNILSNSIKFTPSGGRIEIRTEVSDDLVGERNSMVTIQITDTGKGISPEFLPKIFDRFSQADSSSVRVHGGLGIGLALVRSLLKLQGGTVRAQSEGEGKGSTFTVSLPLDSVSQVANLSSKNAEQRDRSPALAVEELRGLRVLLVDDEMSSLSSIAEMLLSYGADIEMAVSASDAIAVFKKSRPHLVVSDLGMPVEDGYSLIRKIRQLDRNEGGTTAAIALTAYADSESREQALLAGFQEHLAKPISSVDLVRAVLRVRAAHQV